MSSLNRIWAIALNTFREAARIRVLYGILVLVVGANLFAIVLGLAAVAVVPGAVEAFRGPGNLFAVLGSEAEVLAYRPDMAAIAAATGTDGLAITAPGDGTDMASRYFWPSGGVPEDAVTGSIHATLVPFWAARLHRDRLSAFQASRRGGRMDCHLTHDRVHLTGAAVTTLRGHIELPD